LEAKWILILHEQATASIDLETALRIQHILREEMSESTVITIAHRLEAVREADYCVVLAGGRVVEQGPAGEVLMRVHGSGAREGNTWWKGAEMQNFTLGVSFGLDLTADSWTAVASCDQVELREDRFLDYRRKLERRRC
jgi:energy-coupling factor transporter ATP-binding protein EcfA2